MPGKRCRAVKKNLAHTKPERQGAKKEEEEEEEDRGTSGERSPPSGNLVTRKRNSVIREGGTGDRERVSVSDWDFFDKLLKSRKTPSLYSSTKNTAGDVRVNPCTGRVSNRSPGGVRPHMTH